MMHLTVVPKEITVFVPKPAQVDPKDTRNCFTESWENKTGAKGRCPGIGTLLDTDVLVCKYFAHEKMEPPRPTNPASVEVSPSAILYTQDGEEARWQQEGPVRRCSACLGGQKS